jgi:hypothetical protein
LASLLLNFDLCIDFVQKAAARVHCHLWHSLA